MSLDIIGLNIGRYNIVKKLGAGIQGETYLAKDDLGGELAIKFITTADKDWRKEAEKAVKVRKIEQVATVFEVDEKIVEIKGKPTNLRYIVWEYIEGEPLWNLLKLKKPIPASLIVDLTEQICYGIKGMQEVGLQHGDLHANNIMLVPPEPWSIDQKYRIKIVDFGLAQSARGEKFSNDMDHLKMILQECWKCNQYYAGKELVQDKKFQTLLTDLINRMCDSNPERKLEDPIEVVRRIHGIHEQSESKEVFTRIDLVQPFEYLSAEQMPENSDLLSYLYADNTSWLQEITGFGTSIISGPRGSGKSMILKNMRLLTKLRSNDFFKGNLDKLQYLGFYVHCQHNLYFPFAGIKLVQDVLTYELFMHYLNLLFIAEILDTIIQLEELKVIIVSPENKQKFVDFLSNNVFQENNFMYLSPKNILNQCKLVIEKEILYTQKCIMSHEEIKQRTTVSFLKKFIDQLDNYHDFFKTKRIYFLLDDYSDPKIPFNIQKSINRLVSYRNHKFCFKISTEKFGFIPEDMDGKILQQDREFSYVDLGTRYINAKRPEKKEFIKKILEKRLGRAKLKLSVEQFFGHKTYSKKIAEVLIKDHSSKERSVGRFEYSGFDTIYRLCGGDVSTMLQLCNEMFVAASTEQDSLENGIKSKLQDQIIRNFSQKRLEMIKEIPGTGMELYQIVESFGNISKKYLYEYSIAEKDAKFLEVLRIELTENMSCLDAHSSELYQQLVTNTIFLDGGGTYPWGKGTANVKLILRPIYTPALRISYSNRYSVKIGCSVFQNFLIMPKEFEKTGTKFLKTLANKQTSLFPEKFDVELSDDHEEDEYDE